MKIQNSLSIVFLGLFFLACGGSSSREETKTDNQQVSPEAGSELNTREREYDSRFGEKSSSKGSELNTRERESVASILHGSWYLDEYFNVIAQYNSVLKANKNVDNVYKAGFMEGLLMEESPMAFGGSAHDGGFSAELYWDEQENAFRSKPDGQNSITSEPFMIEIISDSMMKFVYESNQPDRVYRKIEGGGKGLEKAINDILFTGTYKLEGGETVTFTPGGRILGYGQHEDIDYEVVQDFFELGMDALEVFIKDEASQLFHYEINEDGFVLYDIYGDEPGAFEKGDLVNTFTRIENGKDPDRGDISGTPGQDVEIKTNYHDLPEKYAESLKKQLHASNLKALDSESLSVLQDYFESNVLSGNSQFGFGIRSNYFWYVYNALPDFVSKKERHSGYYKNQNDQGIREKLLAYAIYRLDRSPENIERLYQYARPMIKKLFPIPDHDRRGIQRVVRQLLAAHERISEIDGYKQKLSDAYAAADTMTGTFVELGGGKREFRKFENSAYGFSVHELNEHVMRHLKPDVDRFHSMPAGLSFWMRRSHEGNMDVVHSILKEIEEMM